ncbi:uncharacterized protein LOC129565830 isoform X4 [Sitodiplosis mosellana]|uniref:uncharacterized protein LOC129565830 isoform X4 n=1 Tax=Sitodiplosis mosellana TaxID=263140 RepID=UPI0024443A10|nr:uncharacterized protein LOC129565830 isoform X4 [Sitodiplosis mosellana]
MEIINVWILKLVLTWIISTVECDAVDRTKRDFQNEVSNNNAEFFRDDVSPITHMELGEEKRTRRNSEFDRGYDEFLRNYYNDNGVDRRGQKYQVNESDEGDSADSSSTSDEDDGDDDESESAESEEHRKKYKPKANGKNKNKKDEQKAPKKKSKHCKTVKRGNMLCSVCYNPKNDEKAESCSYNSDPSEKNKNYEYSEDTSYSTRDKKPEEFDGNNENDESDENEGKKKRPPVNKYPAQHHRPQSQHESRYQPPPPPPPSFAPRPHQNQNYGPQTFLPQNFQPISVLPTGNGRPIRIQIKSVPPQGPPFSLIRYRTVETPFGNQHIRLITYPNGPPSSYPPQNYHQNRPQPPSSQYYNNRRPVSAAQEFRPPRDINGAHSESLLSNVTKEHQFEYLPNHSHNGGNREYAAFMKKDWSRCRKTMENNQVCFECYVEGERRKECMFANVKRPGNFYKSYSTSKKFNTNHPYAFDLPVPSVSKHSKHIEQNSNTHSGKRNKNKDYSVEQFGGDSNSDERFSADLKLAKYEEQPNNSNDWNVDQNGKQERPQAQPLHSSVADIVYGKARPGPEPLAIFFQTDPTIFDTIDSNNNNTNIDLNPNISTNNTKAT